jgi:PTH1 family peptidyl-tRNA hydrolase
MVKLIVGLGNPGEKYSSTRHNVGFMVVDKIFEKYSASNFQKKFNSEFMEIRVNNCKVFLLKPHTYMNLSGRAVFECANFYKIPSEDVLVIYDDLDLELGKIKVRQNGGSGGHNGIKSIDECLDKNYMRLRIGITKPINKQMDISSYVLTKFNEDEKELMDNVFTSVINNISNLIDNHYENFMNSCAIDYHNFKKGTENGN